MDRGGGSFFGRRHGKTLKPSQRGALGRLLPELLLDVEDPTPVDLAALFPVPIDGVRLEIGFGGGEHLLTQAARAPGTGFIGVEPFENGLAKAVLGIERDALRNIRLFRDDAVRLMDWLPAASVGRVDLLYPDPWPKTRHRKRRFVNGDNLDRLVRILVPGGAFRFASDVDTYVRWTLREAARHGGFRWVEGDLEGCRAPWPDWVGTRYEAKAVAEGRRPAYLTFRKSPAR